MSRSENCPTCGTKLGPSHARTAMQSCTACNQMNPAGFIYCGFCATPMESTEMRAQIAELAAPPGGWPNLTSELVEVRFYLQQGLFDDAYELLSILQKRHPGHPQLSELARRPKVARRVDTGVMALVDSVLAESANLVAKVPRRAAPRFTAPAQGGADRTDVHSVVPTDDEPTTARTQPQRPKTGGQSTTRRTGGQPATGSRAASGSHRTTQDTATPRRASTGSNRTAEPAAPARREPTRIYRAVEPPAATRAPAPQPAPARPSPASAPRSASAGARGEPSAPRAVVQAPAIATPSMPATGRASSTPRAPSAPSAAPRTAAPAARASESASGASSRAPEPAVTGRTVVQRPPQSGHTVVVDALQAPAPFPAPDDAQPRRAGSRRRRDAEPAAPAPAAEAAPPTTPAEQPAAAPKTEQPRRRASFGEHVLNRLR